MKTPEKKPIIVLTLETDGGYLAVMVDGGTVDSAYSYSSADEALGKLFREVGEATFNFHIERIDKYKAPKPEKGTDKPQ
jgi:hypothetical protein